MFDHITPPAGGEVVTVREGLPEPCDRPIIPFVRGDGIGMDITPVMQRVIDAAVAKAYGGKKQIVWFEVYAGDAAAAKYGANAEGEKIYLPNDTVRAISYYKVAIKGPLSTPVGGGIRSLNVAMRQIMDLYACVRPIRWFAGVPSPVKHPEKLNVIIFRENTEDVYAGVEFPAGSKEADHLIELLNSWSSNKIRKGSAIGIKPMSAFGSERIVRAAIRHALRRGRRTVTMVHKGNIMKFTSGAFRDWGYAMAKREFKGRVITEDELYNTYQGRLPAGQVLLNDRIADSMFQQVLLRPEEYEVLATPNLNGDYLSDACAAQVGGLGMAPGANIGDEVALFEATHGTAPKYAGQDKVNPGSLILSAHMMLEHLGWDAAANLVVNGLQNTIQAGIVTYDLARQMERAKEVSCSAFGEAIIDHMEAKPAAKAPRTAVHVVKKAGKKAVAGKKSPAKPAPKTAAKKPAAKRPGAKKAAAKSPAAKHSTPKAAKTNAKTKRR